MRRRRRQTPKSAWAVRTGILFAGLVFVWWSATGASCRNSGATSPSGNDHGAGSPTGASGGAETKQEETVSPDAKPLARHAWSDRPVVVFAKGPDHPTYERQMALLEAHDAGLRERDVVVYRVLDEGTSSGPDGALSAETVRALRNRFEPKGGFTVLLVGKDTGEKLRRDDVLSARALFETIDAMPMRRREMREGDGPSSD